MKRVIYILVISFHALLGLANDAPVVLTDSLLAKAQTMPHDSTRLQLLEKAALAAQGSDRYLEAVRTFYKEARMQNNSHYMCNAAYFHVLHYYNAEGDQDSIAKWVNLIKPIAQNIKYWKIYFNSQKLLINIYIYKRQYEYAFNEAIQMMEKANSVKDLTGEVAAYQCLANIYHETNRLDEEEQVLKKAYALTPQIAHSGAQINILCQLINFSNQRKNYADLETYLDKTNEILDEMVRLNPEMEKSFFDQRLFLEIFYTHLYIGINDLQSARQHYEKAQTYITPNSYPSYLATYINTGITYHLCIKNYDKALALADSAIRFVRKYDFGESDYAKEMSLKADVLKEMGRYAEALPLYERVTQIQDSIDIAVSNQQLEEIKDTYHLNLLILEQDKLKGYIQIIVLAMVGIVLILCIAYMLRINRIRKALRLSENKTKEAKRKTEEANEMKNRFLTNMSHAIRVPLNSVVGFSQLMSADTEISEDVRKEYSNIIQQNTEKLMLLVNNVLDLSRLEAGMMKYQLTDYDIVQLCNDAISTARMQSPQRHIEFRNSMEQYIIRTDCNRMMQMIISTLNGTSPTDRETGVVLFSLEKNGEILCFKVTNSPLATGNQKEQETSIRHDINRLLLKHFGGTYQVITDATEGSSILFTYPATSIQ